MKYISVTVETTGEAEGIVSLILIEEGSEGVSVKDPADFAYIKERVYWDYDCDTAPDDGKVYVTGVYEKDKDLKPIKRRLKSLLTAGGLPTGSLDIKTAVFDSSDYEDEWKKYYKVIEIGNLAVVPAWISYSGDKAAVLINPGKAFGTGSHETTSMCLQLLQDFEIKGKRVLDIGCGSGILGLSALRLGAAEAYLSDIDPQAIEAAGENAALNNLEGNVKIVLWGEREIDRYFGTGNDETACGKSKIYGNNDTACGKSMIYENSDSACGKSKIYENSDTACGKSNIFDDVENNPSPNNGADICLANLTADILLKLRPSINSLVKKGGALIISGIINERADEIKAAFSEFTLINSIVCGQWQAFSFTV